MFCLIHEEKVIQIEDTPFEVAPPLVWVETSNQSVQVGWKCIDNHFQEPEEA